MKMLILCVLQKHSWLILWDKETFAAQAERTKNTKKAKAQKKHTTKMKKTKKKLSMQ
jgi:hypothetical protein